jgi:hypothetical protein
MMWEILNAALQREAAIFYAGAVSPALLLLAFYMLHPHK